MTFEPELPEILPIFPLTGVLLLPGGRLPLHVFEPRYRNMIEDALETDRRIGLIQPFEPNPGDNGGTDAGGEPDFVDITMARHGLDGAPLDGHLGEARIPGASEAVTPQLYEVGCVGEIEREEILDGGRYLILLRGLRRFRICRELPLYRGYRRVEVDYSDYAIDAEESAKEVTKAPLLGALQTLGEGHNIAFEIEKLSELPGLALLNSVAMALPFAPAEKQALLEAPDIEERHEMLLALMHMGIQLEAAQASPTLN